MLTLAPKALRIASLKGHPYWSIRGGPIILKIDTSKIFTNGINNLLMYLRNIVVPLTEAKMRLFFQASSHEVQTVSIIVIDLNTRRVKEMNN